ncbi:MAG: hypothetical protein GF364_01905 [Candidatus Lokiarchaeota archaeon]|nr:hypothetical protein [Candidatus Lokiarchaeota archaeon]
MSRLKKAAMDDPRLTTLKEAVLEFTREQTGIKGQIVISYPAGVPISSSWEEDVDPILIGAVSASINLTFQNLCNELEQGNLNRVFVNSEFGRVIIQSSGSNAILITIVSDDADIYPVAFIVKDFSHKIAEIIGDYVY